MRAGNTRGENRGEGSESAWQKIQDGGMRGAATAKFNRNSPRRYKRRRAPSRLDFLRLSVISSIYQTHVRPTHATGKRNAQ